MAVNRNHYKIQYYNNHRYLTFPVLTHYGIKHCFTSSDILPFESDTEEQIEKDYDEIFNYINHPVNHRFFTSQVHSDNIETIITPHCGTAFYLGNFFEKCDGLMTQLSDVALLTKFADCTPIVIYDPIKKVIANLHSGWRGTSKKISEKAIAMMSQIYGSKPENLIVVIGPCIGYKDFEVQRDVIDIFSESFLNIDDFYTKKDHIHYLLNMQGIIERSLISIGVKESNIYSADISTFSSDLMHSFRRDGSKSGRMTLVTIL
ncbi:MAG: peptidoglycan editing factor PgeF [Proteocatella sp.]